MKLGQIKNILSLKPMTYIWFLILAAAAVWGINQVGALRALI